jgi:hypothetical protein
MKGFIHARAGGAGGGSKPVAPPPPAPIPDWPRPPSPFETGTTVPTREGEHLSHVIAWGVVGVLALLIGLMVSAAIYNKIKKK